MSICLIDTSVFCEILNVPNKSQRHQHAIESLAEFIENDVILLLPMCTILETGNHIGQNGSGRQRRAAAERFVEQVIGAIRGEAPWTPTPLFEADELLNWLEEFPNHAMRSDSRGKGSGLGDLAITKECQKQRELYPGREVFIWSYDEHLVAWGKSSM